MKRFQGNRLYLTGSVFCKQERYAGWVLLRISRRGSGDETG
jgi:hypothetical protein